MLNYSSRSSICSQRSGSFLGSQWQHHLHLVLDVTSALRTESASNEINACPKPTTSTQVLVTTSKCTEKYFIHKPKSICYIRCIQLYEWNRRTYPQTRRYQRYTSRTVLWFPWFITILLDLLKRHKEWENKDKRDHVISELQSIGSRLFLRITKKMRFLGVLQYLWSAGPKYASLCKMGHRFVKQHLHKQITMRINIFPWMLLISQAKPDSIQTYGTISFHSRKKRINQGCLPCFKSDQHIGSSSSLKNHSAIETDLWKFTSTIFPQHMFSKAFTSGYFL